MCRNIPTSARKSYARLRRTHHQTCWQNRDLFNVLWGSTVTSTLRTDKLMKSITKRCFIHLRSYECVYDVHAEKRPHICSMPHQPRVFLYISCSAPSLRHQGRTTWASPYLSDGRHIPNEIMTPVAPHAPVPHV